MIICRDLKQMLSKEHWSKVHKRRKVYNGIVVFNLHRLLYCYYIMIRYLHLITYPISICTLIDKINSILFCSKQDMNRDD